MPTQTKQAKAANGRCPDGQPHRWRVSEPEYEWQGAQYVEVTCQYCLRCHIERENVCPIPTDVWKGDDSAGSPIQWYKKG